jgi:hypothetical protein
MAGLTYFSLGLISCVFENRIALRANFASLKFVTVSQLLWLGRSLALPALRKADQAKLDVTGHKNKAFEALAVL